MPPRKKKNKRLAEAGKASAEARKQGKPALHTCVHRTDCSGAAAKATAQAAEDPETTTLEALVALASGIFCNFINSG